MEIFEFQLRSLLPHIIFILSVVCTVGICEFCPFSSLFFRVLNLLLWAPSAAYNNLINTLPIISLYMSQIRGSCGHLKGKYDSHSSCINCSGCSRFNCCVQCHSWTDSIWDLASVVSWQTDVQEEGIQRETAEGLSFETLF